MAVAVEFVRHHRVRHVYMHRIDTMYHVQCNVNHRGTRVHMCTVHAVHMYGAGGSEKFYMTISESCLCQWSATRLPVLRGFRAHGRAVLAYDANVAGTY